MHLLLALLACLLAGPLLAQDSANHAGDEAAIKGVVKKYLDAREEKDPKAVEALFTEDADQLVSSGEWRKGRDSIVKGTLGSSETNPGKRSLTVETVRFLDPGMVIADARYEILGTDGRPTRKMWSTFVMKKVKNSWRISAIRNMLPSAPAQPASTPSR